MIVRIPNPYVPTNSIVGIWGCRAESTYATARYLHRSFKAIAGEDVPPSVVLLAVRGQKFNVVDPMYIATDTKIERSDDLLGLYLRPEPAELATPSAETSP